MELSVVAIIVTLLGAALYFKKKSDDSNSDALLAEKRGEDKILKREQDEVKEEIEKVKNEDSTTLTPEERAKRWNN